MKFAPLVALGLGLSSASFAAEPVPDSLQTLIANAKDLPTLEKLSLLEREANHSDRRIKDWAAQSLAALRNELGDYPGAIEAYPYGPINIGRVSTPDWGGWTVQDAVAAIERLAAERRLVMINEAHHVGQTRVLTLALLPKLRALGFTHFAMEALREEDSAIGARGYPVLNSGNYLREPTMAELVRTALALGFELVPYETALGTITPEKRESEQARHLYERTFAKDSEARVFVHAGYAHVHEKAGYLMKVEPLAMQMRARTGFDPLTIDQTLLRADLPNREFPAYRSLLANGHAASVFIDADGEPVSLQADHVDISVILADTPSKYGRAGWLAALPGRRAYSIPDTLCKLVRPCLIEARLASESADAMMRDRWVRREGAAPGHLLLAPGSYVLTATGSNGKIATRPIEIESEESSP